MRDFAKLHVEAALKTVWVQYEKLFTNNYKIIDENYLKFLNQFKNEEYNSDVEIPYRRVWTLPVNTYANNELSL